MIEQGRKRRAVTILVSGLAVAAVAGVAIAGTAVARNRQSSGDSAVAGGGPATPVAQTPVTPTVSPQAVPTPAATTPAQPTSAGVPPGAGSKPVVPKPPKPQKPPADPVVACKSWLKDADAENSPGSGAKAVARLDGAPGTVLILADSKNWVGCDTAFARTGGGRGSIREPARVTGPAPGDAEAFTVANNSIPVNGKQYQYYWSAGRLPAGVTKISYAFSDGQTTNAVIQGKYWLMQHQTPTPSKDGDFPPATMIKVTLYGAHGKPLRDFLLVWGEDTCAQITHGC